MKLPPHQNATSKLIELLDFYCTCPLWLLDKAASYPQLRTKKDIAIEVSAMVHRVEKARTQSRYEEYVLKREKFCDPKRVPKFARDLIKAERPAKIDRSSVGIIAKKYLVERRFVLNLWGIDTKNVTPAQRKTLRALFRPFPTMTRAEEIAADLLLDRESVAAVWNNAAGGRDWATVNKMILEERPVNGDFKRRPKGVLRKADRVAAEFFTTRSKVMRLWRNGAPRRVSGPS